MSWIHHLFLISIFLLQMEYVECSGKGEIQFLQYSDRQNMDGNIASEYSDFFFKPLEIKDEDGNVLYKIEETQKKYLDQEYLDLTQDPILKDKITVNIPTNKTVYIDITVWDYDGDSWDPGFIRSITNMIVPFHLKEKPASLTTWHVRTFRDPPEPDATDGQGTLKIYYRILECDKGFTGLGCNFCAEGWKGDSCNECADNFYPAGQCKKFCEPETNRYTCTSEGDKQCLIGWTGDSCSECAERWTGDSCSECAEGWTGDSCSECAEGWTGDSCSECAERWTGDSCSECAEGWTGDSCSECAEGWTGDSCSECAEGWTGDSCSKCAEGWTGDSCSDCAEGWTGDSCSECADNYYPSGQCTKLCEPDADRYECTSLGEKQCLKNREGVQCEECKRNFYGDRCTVFCEDSSRHTCNQEGHKICRDRTASPEKDCKKSNIIMMASIGGGVALFVALIGAIACVCRRKTGEQTEKRDENLERNEIYDTLDVTVEDSAYNMKQTGKQSSVYVKMNLEAVNEGKQRNPSHTDYVDMNLEFALKADARIHITEDSDVVYSTVNKNNLNELAPQADPDDSFYSTLHDKDKSDASTTVPARDVNENADSFYATLHGKEAIKTEVTIHHHDDDNYDTLYSDVVKREHGLLYENSDDVNAKLDGAKDASTRVNLNSPHLNDFLGPLDRDEEDDDDNEPVYSIVNKEEVAMFKFKCETSSSLGDRDRQDAKSSACEDMLSETIMTDEDSSAIFRDKGTNNLSDSLEDLSALYSTVNK
ncbi:hypothetical protein ACHWQZ_G015724 [Mnemiopsis leidyi]